MQCDTVHHRLGMHGRGTGMIQWDLHMAWHDAEVGGMLWHGAVQCSGWGGTKRVACGPCHL